MITSIATTIMAAAALVALVIQYASMETTKQDKLKTHTQKAIRAALSFIIVALPLFMFTYTYLKIDSEFVPKDLVFMLILHASFLTFSCTYLACAALIRTLASHVLDLSQLSIENTGKIEGIAQELDNLDYDTKSRFNRLEL